jgi:hypothetical protein
MGPLQFQLGEVDFDDQRFFLVHRGLGDNFSGGIGNKTLSPEFDSISSRRRFVPCSVRYCNVTTVGDSMRSLDRLPRGMLSPAMGLFLAGMPADRCGIKKNFSAPKSG